MVWFNILNTVIYYIQLALIDSIELTLSSWSVQEQNVTWIQHAQCHCCDCELGEQHNIIVIQDLAALLTLEIVSLFFSNELNPSVFLIEQKKQWWTYEHSHSGLTFIASHFISKYWYLFLRFFHTVLSCLVIRALTCSLSLQHIVAVLPCSRGSSLPLHLATYIHPCAPTLHVGYRLHPDTLHSRPPLQLSASTQGAAHRRGKNIFIVVCDILSCTECGALDSQHFLCWTIAPGNDITLPLLFPQVLVVDLGNSRFLRQVEATDSRDSLSSCTLARAVTPLHSQRLDQMLFEYMLIRCSVLTVFTSVLLPPQLDDEDSILPHKLQAALEHVLDKRRELACEKGDLPNGDSAFLFLFLFSCMYTTVYIYVFIGTPQRQRCKTRKSKEWKPLVQNRHLHWPTVLLHIIYCCLIYRDH